MLTRCFGVGVALTFLLAFACGPPAEGADASGNVSITKGGSNGSTNVEVEAEHSDPTSGSGGATQVGSNSPRSPRAPGRVCTYHGYGSDREVPCETDTQWWSDARNCYVSVLVPQPPADHTIWDGNYVGTIYECLPPGASFSAGQSDIYWFQGSDPGTDGTPGPAGVDPVTLAERAVDRMELVAPAIGMRPLKAGAPLLVGMDAWLWVDNAGDNAYGPITRTATAGPVSVTATARVARVVWDLGDGTRVTCRSAGTTWSPAKGTGASPTCGHRYLTPSTNQPGGAFTVRATTHWEVDWSGAGDSGTLRFTMAGERQQPVTEVQVLQTR